MFGQEVSAKRKNFVNDWNKLPDDIVSIHADSVKLLKSRLGRA